jgi:peptide/nickel transport system substrate-binding protein
MLGANRMARIRLTRSLALVFSVVFVSLLATASATGDANAHRTKATKVSAAKSTAAPLFVNYTPPPVSVDPAVVCSLEDDGFIDSLYVTLVRYGTKPIPGAPPGVLATQEDTTKFVPYLAKSWTITNGAKTYTFNLQSGVKFPDGHPVDASAVKYSLERNLTMGQCGAYFTNAGQTTGGGIYASISAPNPTTLVIKLKRPQPLLLHTLTEPNNGIVDASVVEAHGGIQKGKVNPWMASHSAGSGPYVLQEYDPGRRAVFAANPTFFGPKAIRQQVIVNFITSDPTLLLQARTGKADITVGLTKASVASLKANTCCNIVKVDTSSWQLIGLPHKVPPFDNPTFREALTYAVPYQEILNKVAFGFGKIYYGPFPPAFPTFNAALEAPRAFDLTKAKELIKKSGAKLPVNIDMVISEGVLDQEQIATIVQGVWRQLGVNLRIKKLSSAEYSNAIYAPVKKYTLIRFDGPSVTDPAWLLDYDMRCQSIFNTSNYCSKTAEALLNKVEPNPNLKVRQKVWNQITRIWVQDSPRIPVYALTQTIVLKKGIMHYYFAQDNMSLNLWG